MSKKQFAAHIRTEDSQIQTLEEHLTGVAKLSREYASKIGYGSWGGLIAFLHDVAKCSSVFQNYIKTSSSINEQDNDEAGDTGLSVSFGKGRIDHSTAGAQYIWNYLVASKKQGESVKSEKYIAAEILALCVACHHCGLTDMLDSDGTDLFAKRMGKDVSKTHLEEALIYMSSEYTELGEQVDSLLSDEKVFEKFRGLLSSWIELEKSREESCSSDRVQFKLGCFAKFLSSCLIDADRCDTIDFCVKGASEARLASKYTDWNILSERLEKHLSLFAADSHVNCIRSAISEDCRRRGLGSKGIYTLTVPTGGGKTLAALRFALEHAKKHYGTNSPIERIFYVIPYTSIIDQNAAAARNILETDADRGRVVLECHSNLAEELDTWQGKLLSENWDAPIVFTTNVQFLEAIFGRGTKGIRKFHQFANSVIIFDEIQMLPIKTVHLFCGVLDFLVNTCGVTAVLCTATQPCLNRVDKKYGSLYYGSDDEIIANPEELFRSLKRVKFVDKTKEGGYSTGECADFILDKQAEFGNVLVIVNTTAAAKRIFNEVRSRTDVKAVHLSAQMCPAHRKAVLEEINIILKSKTAKLICISTQVMEAGIDVSFNCGIRSVAGLDSMIQAGGRVNREGNLEFGYLYIININQNDENLDKLESIKLGRDVSLRIMEEFNTQDDDISSPDTIEKYFDYYFYKLNDKMLYSIKADRTDTILNLLSANKMAPANRRRKLRQAFGTAGNLFEVIDAPTKGVIVPYGEGKEIIAKLCQEYSPAEAKKLIHKAQRYSVNLYPYKLATLSEQGALYSISPCGGLFSIWVLKEEYYSEDFGIGSETVSKFRAEVM